MKIAMIGTGYVGLVSGVCFSDFGHEVICVDKDADKIARLERGEVPIFEPGLEDLMGRNIDAGRLSFTRNLERALDGVQAVFIAVGTPTRRGDGHADLSYVMAAAEEIVVGPKREPVQLTYEILIAMIKPPKLPLRHPIARRLLSGNSGNVFGGMATLAFGSGLSRIIGVATIPILTRLYSPEDFGLLALFTAIVALLAPLVTLRYALAIPLPRQDGIAANLFALSASLMLILSAAIAVILWVCGEAMLRLASMNSLAPWWWLISLGVLGTATYELLTLWATRQRDYKLIAQSNVTQSVGGAIVKVGLGALGFIPLGLLLGQTVAQAGGIGRLIKGASIDFKDNLRKVSVIRARKVAWRYRSLPIWRVPSQFLMALSANLPLLFVADQYGATVAGQFGVALMLLRTPIQIISTSASQAFFGEISNPEREFVIKEVALTFVRRSLAILAPCSLIIWIFSVDLVPPLLGNDWTQASIFIKYFSIYLGMSIISVALTPILYTGERQATLLVVNSLRLALLGICFFSASYFSLSETAFVLAYSCTMLVYHSCLAAFLLLEAGNQS